MNLIVVALRPEAEPFIEALKLKRDLTVTSHEVYCNNDFELIISGSGAVPAAIATTLLLQRQTTPVDSLVNIGTAGAPEDFQKGTLIQISKITGESEKTFFPDLTIHHRLPFAALQTSSSPVLAPANWPANILADMEAAGFFEAAQRFVPLENILVLKVVTDHFSSEGITKAVIKESIAPHIATVLTAIESIRELSAGSPETPLSTDETHTLRDVIETLSLTKSQQDTLWQKAVQFKVSHETPLPNFSNYLEQQPKDKQEAKRVFQEVLGEFNQ